MTRKLNKKKYFNGETKLEKLISSNQYKGASLVILDDFDEEDHFGTGDMLFYTPQECIVNTKYDNICNALRKGVNLALPRELMYGFDSKCLEMMQEHNYQVYFACTPFSTEDLSDITPSDWDFCIGNGYVIQEANDSTLSWTAKDVASDFAYNKVKSFCDLGMLHLTEDKSINVSPYPVVLHKAAKDFMISDPATVYEV